MSFMRFLGSRTAPGQPVSAPLPVDSETEAVRHIVARLETLPPDQARFLAWTAYVLARAANADMEITDVETQAIETVLFESGLDQSQAVLVAEMAKLQERTSGGTSDYLVTREFREASTPEQRLALLEACFKIAAADGAITAMESSTLDEIASELDIEREELSPLRAKFADFFSARLGFKPQK
jgi:uncharacterized tellurite resistance protein B-like protein